MRISDWSSDVCSSDLIDSAGRRTGIGRSSPPVRGCYRQSFHVFDQIGHRPFAWRSGRSRVHILHVGDARPDRATNRSEEHTSELQSLMRISYAVFCLKKKKMQSKTSTIYIKHNSQINNNNTNYANDI